MRRQYNELCDVADAASATAKMLMTHTLVGGKDANVHFAPVSLLPAACLPGYWRGGV